MTALSLSISRLLANIHHWKETVKAISDLRSSNPASAVTRLCSRTSPNHVHPPFKVQNFVITLITDGIAPPPARKKPGIGCIDEEKMTLNLLISAFGTQG
jgi:hypothetical protein